MRTRIVTRVLTLVLLTEPWIVSVHPPRGAAVAQSPEELKARGEYIFTSVQGCGCHTSRNPDGSDNMKLYLAGAPSKTPPKGPPANVGWSNPRWKKLFASNITPDTETGIGRWSEAQFMSAMRTGINPVGRKLDPFMPWAHFMGITDTDLKAIWAYLRSVKPIKNKVPKSVPLKK